MHIAIHYITERIFSERELHLTGKQCDGAPPAAPPLNSTVEVWRGEVGRGLLNILPSEDHF